MRIHAESTDVTKCGTTGNTLSKVLFWTMGNQKTRNKRHFPTPLHSTQKQQFN